ncbi:MAG: M28 family metallopeptidase [Promethearchaeota archaeon]
MSFDISKFDSEYMYNFIERIIKECGPRMPCSPQEAKSAEIIKTEFEKMCDSSSIEPFTCHPRAFIGFIKVMVVLMFISFIIYFLTILRVSLILEQIFMGISFVLNLGAFLIIWNEFFNYREFIDPFFKKKTSQNVIGVFESKKEVKNILIFSGHNDSALHFRLLTHLKIGYVIIVLLGLLILILWIGTSTILFILSLIGFKIADFFAIQIFVLILFVIGIPVLIALWFFVPFGEKANKVPGAVDNLSAVAIVLGMGKYLKINPDFIPENTEIRLISFGCEEAGLRGAYRYVEEHYEELKTKNAICINMDAIQSLSSISIIDFEPTTRTKHSEEVVKILNNSAKDLGIPISKSSLGGSSFVEKLIGQVTGGTDATAFSKGGLKAASIVAMDLKKMPKFYHQPTDTLDKIEKGVLERVLKLCINSINIIKNKS